MTWTSTCLQTGPGEEQQHFVKSKFTSNNSGSAFLIIEILMTSNDQHKTIFSNTKCKCTRSQEFISILDLDFGTLLEKRMAVKIWWMQWNVVWFGLMTKIYETAYFIRVEPFFFFRDFFHASLICPAWQRLLYIRGQAWKAVHFYFPPTKTHMT